MTYQTLLTISKFILLFGGVLTAVGTFGSFYFSNKIKTSAPELQIRSLTPVMLYQYKEFNFDPDKKIKFMDKGVCFVIHLKSKSKLVTVNRLKIRGKIFISPNMYLAQDGNVGRNIKEILQEWEKRKPYILADWTAYLDKTKSVDTLNAFDDKVLSFTLIDPIASGFPESGWTVPFSDYLGYSDGSKKPNKMRTYPEFDFIFKTEIGKEFPFDIRDEIKNSHLEFILVAGSKEYPIPFTHFKKSKLFRKEYWDKNPVEKIIFRDQ